MSFVTKTIHLRKCRRCQSTWAAEHIELNVEDKIEFIMVTVAHCPVCSQGFAAEIDRPSYQRVGKKINGR